MELCIIDVGEHEAQVAIAFSLMTSIPFKGTGSNRDKTIQSLTFAMKLVFLTPQISTEHFYDKQK